MLHNLTVWFVVQRLVVRYQKIKYMCSLMNVKQSFKLKLSKK